MKTCLRCKTNHNNSGNYCSRSCANSRDWSSAKRSKLSQKMRGYRFGGAVAGVNLKPKVRKACLGCGFIFHVIPSKSNKKYCSDLCARRRPNQGGFRANSTRKHRSIYKNSWMDSGSELQFAELLDKHQIRWIKNTTQSFDYVDSAGKKRRYYPDFYLPDYDYWVEIKGLFYRHKNDVLKLNAVGSNIEIQYHNAIKLPLCVI